MNLKTDRFPKAFLLFAKTIPILYAKTFSKNNQNRGLDLIKLRNLITFLISYRTNLNIEEKFTILPYMGIWVSLYGYMGLLIWVYGFAYNLAEKNMLSCVSGVTSVKQTSY